MLHELFITHCMKYKVLNPKSSDPITQEDNFTTSPLVTFWDSMIVKILVLCLTTLGALSQYLSLDF